MILFTHRFRLLPRIYLHSLLGALLLLTVAAVVLLSGCSSAWNEGNAKFKKGRKRCPPNNYRVSCDYSPDGQLYRRR